MLLRTATQEDKKDVLFALWESAFGDTKETIETFLSLCCTTENILVAEADGRVRAALYLLENKLQIGENIYRAAYIYAAATEQSYRKNGFMTALLRYAEEIAARRNIDFLFLTPANADLFAYYEKRGFQTAFSKQVVSVSRAQLQEAAEHGTCAENDFCAERVSRETALQGIPHIVWSDAVLQFDRVLRNAYGVQSVFLPQGFSVFETEESTAAATEFCFSKGGFSVLAQTLLQNTEAVHFTLCIPCFADMPPQFTAKTVAVAMAKPISARAKTETVQNAYLGITLG